MLTTFSVFFVILRCSSVKSKVMNSMIWNKARGEFVNLYSIPAFAALQENESSSTQIMETYDFKGQDLKVAYYEDRNIAMFTDNDTKITGVYGEIWNTLAEYLNLRVVPVKYGEHDFGMQLENGSYTGLMGLLDQNKTHVILRTGLYTFRANTLQYTTPVWRISYHLYIQPRYKYDNTWIITIFARRTWYCIIFTLFLLTAVGYMLQKTANEYNKGKKASEYYNLSDHIFYTFSMTCSQGYLPNDFHNKFKILAISKSLFTWLIFLSYSSNLIYRMTNRTVIPPFTNIGTLLNDTDYVILSFKGSMVYELLKVCYGRHLYALFEVEDRIMANKEYVCPLIPVGPHYYATWVGFALSTTFHHKKAIDTSIIKLQEVGILAALKNRWLKYQIENKQPKTFKMIDMNQVYLIFLILFCGFLLSLVVFAIENIAFFYEKKRN